MKFTPFAHCLVGALATLITLRGAGVIAWPWLWVLAPVWLPASLIFGFGLLYVAMNGLARAVERFRSPWE